MVYTRNNSGNKRRRNRRGYVEGDGVKARIKEVLPKRKEENQEQNQE